MGDHPTWSADDYISACRQRLPFISERGTVTATIHGNGTDVGKVGYPFQCLGYLHSKFPGGNDDHAIDSMPLMRMSKKIVQDREQESGCFTRACLGRGNNISASYDMGYYLLLHGGSLIVAHSIYAIEQIVIKTKISKVQSRSDCVSGYKDNVGMQVFAQVCKLYCSTNHGVEDR